jgi:hypothetical protein
MAQLPNPETIGDDDLVGGVVRESLSTPQREGLPPGFRMRADAHYVDALDAPRAPARPAMPAPAVSAAGNVTTSLLDGLVDDALRGIGSAAGLTTAPSAMVRATASEIVNAESHRALRMLTAARILRGECPLHRDRVVLDAPLRRLSHAIEREHLVLRTPCALTVQIEPALAITASEELVSTAVYGVITALGAITASDRSRRLRLTAAADQAHSHANIEIREVGLTVPTQWLHTALTAAWPVPLGGLAQVLLHAASKVAESHGGSMAMHSDDDGIAVRLMLPLAS